MSRKRFEEFAISVGMRTDKDYDGYIHADTSGGWTIWQNEVTRLESKNDKLRARIAELEAERAELVKDRERLDWLDGKANIVLDCCEIVFILGKPGIKENMAPLRRFIDAAREGE